MKQFIVEYLIPINDVDFLNICDIPFDFMDKMSISDSGWCDGLTGMRILSVNDRLLFTIRGPDDEAVLRLKFGDRLIEIVNAE